MAAGKATLFQNGKHVGEVVCPDAEGAFLAEEFGLPLQLGMGRGGCGIHDERPGGAIMARDSIAQALGNCFSHSNVCTRRRNSPERVSGCPRSAGSRSEERRVGKECRS